MSAVVLQSVTKYFETASGRAVALENVDLSIASGELLLLTGASGCGKTTLLRIVAGLETPSSGKVIIGGKDMTDVPPHERDVAMVFQNPVLYPHMTARENIEFGLRIRGCPAEERCRRADQVAELLGIKRLMDRRPFQLSGGEAQRVALGRAWVRRPDVFLLDEPFASLQTELRAQLRDHVCTLQSTLRATTILVSHDAMDAVGFGGQIALLHEGKVVQTGGWEDFRDRPASRFVRSYTRDWFGEEQ